MKTLEQAVAYFTHTTHSMSMLSLACGTSDQVFSAMSGTEEAQVTSRTVFDLASLTKLFTAIAAMRLWEEGRLDLSAPVTDYAPQFVHLNNVTVDQLLGFEVLLQTAGRVDAQPDRAAALANLFGTTAAPHAGTRFYSDIHAMVLGYVIEAASGDSLYGWLHNNLLTPLGMHETWCAVPPHRITDCGDYSGEHRIEAGRLILRTEPARGVPHDPKARILSPHGEQLCGHAGLFSTIGDMVRLCQGILQGKVLRHDTLLAMSRNRMGHPLPEGGWTQYLGTLCYVKHPCQYFSEIPVYMGSHAIGLSGFAGNHISLDPENDVFCVYLGNRVQNRLSTLLPAADRAGWGLAEDGTGCINWPDGTKVWSSVEYVHLKDEHLHAAVMEVLGRQVIE